jgi:hypothetical protein
MQDLLDKAGVLFELEGRHKYKKEGGGVVLRGLGAQLLAPRPLSLSLLGSTGQPLGTKRGGTVCAP